MIPFRQVGIFSLGLMGGSLAGALRAAGFAGRIVAHSGNAGSLREARERGWIDAGFRGPEELSAAAAGCDLLVMCAPILQIEGTVRVSAKGIDADAILTDVGSTKAALAASLPRILSETGCRARYVPAHPMCGSEKSGFAAARANLYQGANCVVCDDPGVDPEALDRVTAFWRALGCRVVTMGSADHDRWVTRTSHLPHMVASVLADTVGEGDLPPGLLALIGGGFRDTTRVAEGSPAVWSEIAATNLENLLQSLDAFSGNLQRFRNAIASAATTNKWGEVESLLARGADRRRRLMKGPPA